MLLHAWIDFTTFAFSEASVNAESASVALNFFQWGAFVLAVIGVVIVLRRGSHRDNAPQDALAPAWSPRLAALRHETPKMLPSRRRLASLLGPPSHRLS